MSSTRIEVYECDKCRAIYKDKEFADKCCEDKSCCDCSKQIQSYLVRCDSCAEKNRFNNAKNKIYIGEYEGVYVYDQTVSMYFATIDDIYDYHRANNTEVPNYVYGCDCERFYFDIGNALENELSEHYEDAIYDLTDYKELVDYVEQWNEKQNIASYYQDYNTIILLKKEVC